MIVCSELISASLIRFGSSKLPEKDIHRFNYSSVTPDMTNRVKFKSPSSRALNDPDNYINRHGLVKTIYSSNSNITNDIKGIVITGNSAALGHPIAEQGNYKSTFVNLLEHNLRAKDKSIDIVNLSFYGFNSWQENVELARYLNTYQNHNDLPEVDLVASIGGIQDFWDFIDLLYNKNNIYYKANGLMSWKDSNKQYETFYNNSYEAMHGNIRLGAKIFIQSIISSIKSNSSTVEILRRFKENNKKSNLNKIKYNEINQLDIKKTSVRIENILKNKLNITLKDYQEKKKNIIASVIRNKKSMSQMNQDKKLIYVYLPTKITSKNWDIEPTNNFKYKTLNLREIYLIEKDYRKSLIEELSLIKNIRILNMAGMGNDDWFTNISNYTSKGHKKIAQELVPFFQLNLK